LPGFQSPQPNATNLLVNILSYGASLPAAVSKPDDLLGGSRLVRCYRAFITRPIPIIMPATRATAPGHTTPTTGFCLQQFPAFSRGTIGAADLLIKTYGVSTPSLFETYVLRDVTTPIPQLIAGGSGLTGIYADLANGVVYGGPPTSSPPNPARRWVVPLNARLSSTPRQLREPRPGSPSVAPSRSDVPAGNE